MIERGAIYTSFGFVPKAIVKNYFRPDEWALARTGITALVVDSSKSFDPLSPSDRAACRATNIAEDFAARAYSGERLRIRVKAGSRPI